MSELPHSTGFARGGRAQGRGRGRGRGGASAVALSLPPDPANGPTTRPPVASGDPNPAIAPSKFKPRMVKRVAKTECEVLDLSEKPSTRSARGRGRGRGAARGRAEIVMTASGAFAMGPSEGPRAGRVPQGPSQSGMRRIDHSAAPSERSGGPAQSGTATPWDGVSGNAFELYSDGGEFEAEGETPEGAAKVADLNDISVEHPMAPTTLPWDPRRIEEREELVARREAQVAKALTAKLKAEEDEATAQSFASREASASRTPVFTRASTCTVAESIVKSESVEEQDLEAIKAEVMLKREQMEEMAKVGSELGPPVNDVSGSNPSDNTLPLYIFQFPRNFPKFRSATDTPIIPPSPTETPAAVPVRKPILKKKKPQIDDWAGWGKGGRRDECPGVPVGEEHGDKAVEGQIGELVTRRSGRVQMLIGDVAYDVLPAAQATFHQEVAVIDPKPESSLRAMFVLGPTNKKFIVAPDVSSLLERDERERKIKLEQQMGVS